MKPTDVTKLRKQLIDTIKKVSLASAESSISNVVSTDFGRVLFVFEVESLPGQTVVQCFSLAPYAFSDVSAYAYTDDPNCRASCQLIRDSDGLFRAVKIILHDFNGVSGSWTFGQSLPSIEPTVKKVFVYISGIG